jgi:Uma2 family endonuclease
MPFTIDDANLPATLTAHPMTDEEFTAFCAEHPDLNFEMTAEGEITVRSPNNYLTDASNSEVDCELRQWAKKRRHGIVSGPSAGFVLPNGARRSPDAAWTSKIRLDTTDIRKKDGFVHLCPDFVIEVRSVSDRLPPLQRKMREYTENGAQLGWLIDPPKRTVEIYRPNGETETRTGINKIEGEGPVAGFVLDLTLVWDPFAD